MTGKNIFATASLCAAISIGLLAATPALARPEKISGIGSIITDQTGKTIVAPSDQNGEVRIKGLTPGQYKVRVFEGTNEPTVFAGNDGNLAFAVLHTPIRRDPRRSNRGPLFHRGAYSIRFYLDKNTLPKGAVPLDMNLLFRMTPPYPCGAPPRPGEIRHCPGPRPMNHVDVNSSTAAEISRMAPTMDANAASVIVSEREENGLYKDASDFAQRICQIATIDFGDLSVRMGTTAIIMQRGGNPKTSGFKCSPDGDNGNNGSLFGFSLPPILIWLAL